MITERAGRWAPLSRVVYLVSDRNRGRGEAINQRGFVGGWGWAMSTYTPRLPAGLLARWPPLSASGVRLSISVCPSNLFLRCIHVQCPPHRWWRPGGTVDRVAGFVRRSQRRGYYWYKEI
jgi:hypothetical protein